MPHVHACVTATHVCGTGAAANYAAIPFPSRTAAAPPPFPAKELSSLLSSGCGGKSCRACFCSCLWGEGNSVRDVGALGDAAYGAVIALFDAINTHHTTRKTIHCKGTHELNRVGCGCMRIATTRSNGSGKLLLQCKRTQCAGTCWSQKMPVRC